MVDLFNSETTESTNIQHLNDWNVGHIKLFLVYRAV